jgi:hypothetical protein
MKRITTYFLLLLLASATGISCKKENMCDCIKRTGDIVKESRELDPFSRIYVTDNVNVFITQDSVHKVLVEAGDNLIDLVKTEVVNGEIRIGNKNRCNWTRSYKPQINVYLHMPEVRYVLSEGVGTVKSTNVITTPDIDYETRSLGDIHLTVDNNSVIGHMHGAGDIYLSGHTRHHACNIVGNGFIRAAELNTGYTWISSNTSGNSYVKVNDLLQVLVEGSGDIIYSGEPDHIDKVITGTGKLIEEE